MVVDTKVHHPNRLIGRKVQEYQGGVVGKREGSGTNVLGLGLKTWLLKLTCLTGRLACVAMTQSM